MPINLPGQDEKSEPRSTTIEEWGSLNTKANRPAIQPNEFSWIENFMPIGHGNMRTLRDKGSTVYTAGGGLEIISRFPFNLGAVSYVAVFLDDGSAVQVRTSDGATTTIGAAGSFFTPGDGIPCCSQYQSKYLLIGSTSSDDGYFIWDGTSLFQSGTLAPQVTLLSSGVGTTPYSSAPTVTAYGGTGSGATFTASISADGHVDDVVVSNPGSGYDHEDLVTLIFTGGGGSDQARATATVDTTKGGVTEVQITDGGSAYTSDVAVTFAGGGGTGARAVVSVLANGVIVSVTVVATGSGYTSAPTVGFTASAGSGATAIANVTRGQITAITVNSGGAGYKGAPDVSISFPNNGDFPVVQAEATAQVAAGVVSTITVTNPGAGYLSATVNLLGGNSSANATINIMPFGLKAATIETYQDVVWTAVDTKMTFSSPGSVSDFSTSNGGGSAPASDSFLRKEIIALKQANGFLYRMADSSINVISNVQTNTNGTTTFNNSNVDAQIGTAWRDTVIAFGRAILFMNPNGVYALYGGAAEKVSDALDGLFAKASFNTGQSGVTPTASVATIYGIRCACFLFTTTDPFTNTLRDIIAMWDGQKWWCASQTVDVVGVAPEEINSVLTAWGDDGTNLFKLFQDTSDTLEKIFQTKLVSTPGYNIYKQANRGYVVAENNSSTAASIDLMIDNEIQPGVTNTVLMSSSLVFVGTSPITFVGTSAITWTVGGLSIQGFQTSSYGRMFGWTGITTAPDLTMISLTLLDRDYGPYG